MTKISCLLPDLVTCRNFKSSIEIVCLVFRFYSMDIYVKYDGTPSINAIVQNSLNCFLPRKGQDHPARQEEYMKKWE